MVQHGPFVANTRAELQETMQTYRQTAFGGCPWPSPTPDHGKVKGRFSRLPAANEVVRRY